MSLNGELRTWIRRVFRAPAPPDAEGFTLNSPEEVTIMGGGALDVQLDVVIQRAEAKLAQVELEQAQREALSRLESERSAFAIALYKALVRNGEDLVFSPLGVRMALALAFLGARGATAAEMRDAFNISGTDEAFHEGCQNLSNWLGKIGHPDAQLTLANSLWTQVGLPLLPNYMDRLQQHYATHVHPVDFAGDPAGTRAAVNRWVSEHTQGRIDRMLEAPAPSRETKLLLANAVYFKAAWEVVFDPQKTREAQFFTEGGATIPVKMMHRTGRVRHVSIDGYQAITLPYQHWDFALSILLPDNWDGIGELEARLTPEMVRNALSANERSVEIYLPRFNIQGGARNLTSALTQLGIRSIFDRHRADLSGLSELGGESSEKLFVTDVLHEAFIDVDEEKTEAAAATSMEVSLGLPRRPVPPVVFRADHPFVFALTHLASGAILFLGRYAGERRQVNQPALRRGA